MSYRTLCVLGVIISIILTGAYFVLGNTGQSGPESAPNLDSLGLVGHWTFEEGSGQIIYDRSGNGNDGTLGANSSVGKDDPVFSAGHDSNGPGGMGMSFDGVDDYVNIGDINAIDNATQLSCCAWVYHNSLTDDDYISAHFASGSDGGFLFLRNDSGSLRTDMYKIYVDDGVDTANIESKTNSSLLQEWTYVCFTYIENTANGLKLYINSAEDENSPVSTIGVDDIDSVNDVLNIGANSDGSNPFDGSIDSVRIYNRSLSADEIRQLYNQKKPIFHLKMDEGSGTTVYDSSGNEYHGTLHE